MRVLIITAMYPTQERPACGTFVKEQVESLRDAGVEIDVCAFEGSGSVRMYLKVGFTLRHILSTKSYDLVHAHYGLTGAASLMQAGCPVVITFHGSDLLGGVGSNYQYSRVGKITTIISRIAAFKATQRIVVADILKKKLWPLSGITIPMGVDLSLFKPMPLSEARERLGFYHNKRLVLFAAHPNNYTKRFDIAQKAVRLLQKDEFDIELLPLYNVPHDQVPLYINACNALVLTSMHEASPCIIKEAMACNLPVVSVDVGDVAERIEGVDGCFLCERVPSDVSDKLRRALQIGRCSDGRRKIAELSLQNIATRVMAVYSKVQPAQKVHG
jgi:teichuronic acid biosynthesis glycosyltransferase TuaC